MNGKIIIKILNWLHHCELCSIKVYQSLIFHHQTIHSHIPRFTDSIVCLLLSWVQNYIQFAPILLIIVLLLFHLLLNCGFTFCLLLSSRHDFDISCMASVQDLFGLIGVHEFLPSSKLIKFLASTVCEEKLTKGLCENILFVIAGPDMQNLNAVSPYVNLQRAIV